MSVHRSSRVCLPAVEEAEVEVAEAMDMEMLELDMEKSCFVAKTDGMRVTRSFLALDWNV